MPFSTFAFFCPNCSYRQTVPMTLAGSKIACPGCKCVVKLPDPQKIREETPDWPTGASCSTGTRCPVKTWLSP